MDPKAASPHETGRLKVRYGSRAVLSIRPESRHWTATPLLAPGSWTGLVIEPERAALYANCELRAAQMVGAGALDEVRALVARDLDPALPAMKAVGVREFAAHLAGETTLAAAVVATRQATRNHAKRQLTWFRNQTAGWARI